MQQQRSDQRQSSDPIRICDWELISRAALPSCATSDSRTSIEYPVDVAQSEHITGMISAQHSMEWARKLEMQKCSVRCTLTEAIFSTRGCEGRELEQRDIHIHTKKSESPKSRFHCAKGAFQMFRCSDV